MATVNQQAIEELEARFSELETENSSLADQLAEKTQECDALRAELLRIRATLECDPLCAPSAQPNAPESAS